MSVILFDRDEILKLAAAVKALNQGGFKHLSEAFFCNPLCRPVLERARQGWDPALGLPSVHRLAEAAAEDLIKACFRANREAYERQYGSIAAREVEEAGHLDLWWPEFLEPVPLKAADPVQAVHRRLRSLFHSTYTSDGRIYLDTEHQDALYSLLDHLAALRTARCEGWE